MPLESCQIRKEAALRGSTCVPQISRGLAKRRILRIFAEEVAAVLQARYVPEVIDELSGFGAQVEAPML